VGWNRRKITPFQKAIREIVWLDDKSGAAVTGEGGAGQIRAFIGKGEAIIWYFGKPLPKAWFGRIAGLN